jgi:DNA invertase Pin-like site-specific DNA recombinase
MEGDKVNIFERNNAIENALHPQYAIYLRKSQADRDIEGQTVEEVVARHKKILTDLAAKQGLYIGEIYEEVVSGETIKDRPEFQRLLSDCYAGRWAGVLVVEITRLSRGNQGDAQKIIDCFTYSNHNHGVLVITPTKTYDIVRNPDDLEYMEFELFMSRREYKMITRRMDRGRKQAVVEGEYMGAYRPYGWEIEKTKYGRTLKPHQTEFEVGKMMYEWKVKEGLTAYKIAERLTAMGVPTYKGNAEWSKESVKDFLRNPVNMGKVRWNDRMQVKTMVNGELVTSRPRSCHTDHYMLYDGKQPQMVDEETFLAANADFKPDRTKANLKLTNPLAGLLICPNCGKVMAYQAYKKKPTVQPRFVHKQSSVCTVKSVLASDVMNAVVHSLKLYLEDFEAKADNLPDVNENALETQISSLQKELAKTEKILAKVFDDYEAEIYTANEFVQRKAKHNARIDSIKVQIRELRNSIPEKEEYEEKIMLLSEALDSMLDDDLDADIKNEYMKRIVDRIEFSRENDIEFILEVFLKP